MLIKFYAFRSFYSTKSRDEYNDSLNKAVVCINPKHIVAVEERNIENHDTYPSSYNACEVFTLKGSWTVEGSLGAVLAVIKGDSK